MTNKPLFPTPDTSFITAHRSFLANTIVVVLSHGNLENLEQTLISVKDQSIDTELLILLDDPTPEAKNRIEAWAAANRIPGIETLPIPSLGDVPFVRNAASKFIRERNRTGGQLKYIVFIDGGDTVGPNYVKSLVEHIDANDEIAYVMPRVTKVHVKTDFSRYPGEMTVHGEKEIYNSVNGEICIGIYRLQALDAVGWFSVNANSRNHVEEIELKTKLIRAGYKLEKSQKANYVWFRSGKSKSAKIAYNRRHWSGQVELSAQHAAIVVICTDSYIGKEIKYQQDSNGFKRKNYQVGTEIPVIFVRSSRNVRIPQQLISMFDSHVIEAADADLRGLILTGLTTAKMLGDKITTGLGLEKSRPQSVFLFSLNSFLFADSGSPEMYPRYFAKRLVLHYLWSSNADLKSAWVKAPRGLTRAPDGTYDDSAKHFSFYGSNLIYGYTEEMINRFRKADKVYKLLRDFGEAALPYAHPVLTDFQSPPNYGKVVLEVDPQGNGEEILIGVVLVVPFLLFGGMETTMSEIGTYLQDLSVSVEDKLVKFVVTGVAVAFEPTDIDRNIVTMYAEQNLGPIYAHETQHRDIEEIPQVTIMPTPEEAIYRASYKVIEPGVLLQARIAIVMCNNHMDEVRNALPMGCTIIQACAMADDVNRIRMRNAVNHSDLFTAPSIESAATIPEEVKDVRIMPNPFNTSPDSFRMCKHWNRYTPHYKPSATFKILHVGRISSDKNINLLGEVSNLVDSKKIGIYTTLPFDQIHRHDIRHRLMDQYPNLQYVESVTEISSLGFFDLVISLSNREAFGNSMYEAMVGLRKPVAAVKSGFLKDYNFEDKVHFFELPPGDAAGIARVLTSIVNSDEGYCCLHVADNAYQKIVSTDLNNPGMQMLSHNGWKQLISDAAKSSLSLMGDL